MMGVSKPGRVPLRSSVRRGPIGQRQRSSSAHLHRATSYYTRDPIDRSIDTHTTYPGPRRRRSSPSVADPTYSQHHDGPPAAEPPRLRPRPAGAYVSPHALPCLHPRPQPTQSLDPPVAPQLPPYPTPPTNHRPPPPPRPAPRCATSTLPPLSPPASRLRGMPPATSSASTTRTRYVWLFGGWGVVGW